jgi:replicative superfamily II helicase
MHGDFEMVKRGLFVGIDHYSSDYNSLRFAKRDATALAALLDDNSDARSTLLLDEDATKERMLTELRHLAEISTDEDFVVIGFSGHGVPGGALAMHDSTPDNLVETTLSLDDLATSIRRVRARVLLLVLDCCFSGHAADKVLSMRQDEFTSRDGSLAATKKLDDLRRDGYAVIAASGRNQRAFENQQLRHGLLSYYLIEGLRGNPDAVDGGKLYLFKLAHFVSQGINRHRKGAPSRTQDLILSGPMMNVALPILVPGPRYRATADATRPNRVTGAISSLQPYGIPEPVLRAWKGTIRKLNGVQVDAVNDGGLLEGFNVLVNAPTSSGKTMVGELAAMRAVAEGRKAVFLSPMRAMVHEQYEKFRRLYGTLGYRVVRATGEIRDQISELMSGRFDFAVLTYEKYIGLLTGRPDLLGASVLVLDEIQSLALPERGPRLEILLTRLRIREGADQSPQIVGLSAALGEGELLARWLRANLVTGTHRSVPLVEGVLSPDGLYRYRDQHDAEGADPMLEPDENAGFDRYDEWAARVVGKLVAERQQAIVFRASRAAARGFAERLANTLGLPSAPMAVDALANQDGGRTTDLLRACLARGAAFHIADLTAQERLIVEKSFADGEVKVLVATTTLAQGVNLPADTVIFPELEHAAAQGPYTVAEYKNMAGRAGREGHTPLGRAIILARGPADAERKWQRYVLGTPEDVRSALPGTSAHSVILAALTEPVPGGRRRSGTDIGRFLAATFAAHESRAKGWADPFPRAEVGQLVSELVARGFLLGTPGGVDELPSGLRLTELGNIAVRSALGVDSIALIEDALASVPAERINRATLICAAQLTHELADQRFNRLPARSHREQGHLTDRLRRYGPAEEVLTRLMAESHRSGVSIGRARQALACLMWTEGIGLGGIERAINNQAKKTRPDTLGPVQHAIQRTAAVIRTVIDIALYIHGGADLGDLPDVLPHQLELGIRADLVPIAWHVGTTLDRSVYVRLARNGLGSPATLLAAEPDLLLDCVNGDPELARLVREAAATHEMDEQGWPDEATAP